MIDLKKPYPVDCLGRLGSDFAHCVSNNASAKNALVGPVVLSAMSSAVHGVIDILTPRHTTMPTSLYVCVVAASGMRKSTVVKQAFHGFRDFEDIYESNEDESLNYKKLGSHPYILEDASESGIVNHFHDGAKASAMILDEGGMLKARLDNQRMCKRFDGGDIRVMRHNRMVIERDTRNTFCMTIQDEIFSNLLKSKEGKMMVASGTMPRCLISYATKSAVQSYSNRNINENPLNHSFHNRVRKLMEDYSSILMNSSQREQIKLSHEAEELWKIKSGEWSSLRLFNERWKGLGPFVDRASEQALRIAAVLQYFNEPSTEIQRIYMVSAVILVDWHLDQVLIGFGTPSEEELQTELGNELYAYILRKFKQKSQGKFARVDLLRNGPSSLRKADKLDMAIDQLILEEKVFPIEEGTSIKNIILNATPKGSLAIDGIFILQP